MNVLDKEVYSEIARVYEVYQGPDSAPYTDIDSIYLSDVLRYSCNKENSKNNFFSSPENEGEAQKILYVWNFSKPTYEEQSEECKKFIRNIVK